MVVSHDLAAFTYIFNIICTLPLSNCPDDGMLLGEKSQVIIQLISNTATG